MELSNFPKIILEEEIVPIFFFFLEWKFAQQSDVESDWSLIPNICVRVNIHIVSTRIPIFFICSFDAFGENLQ